MDPSEDAQWYRPDADNPGWYLWAPESEHTFNALFDPIRILTEEPGRRARVRFLPRPRLRNFVGSVHGGAIMSFIDIALFAGARGCGFAGARNAVTLDLSTQFVGGADVEAPIDALVELVRETGRLVFVRGVVEQEIRGAQEIRTVASFIATLRKGR